MKRNIVWSALDQTGLEHLVLESGDDGFSADGSIIAKEAGAARRIHYRIRGDRRWRVREVAIEIFDGPGVILKADGDGRWFDSSGAALPELTGCIDVDISATPFTNTLPVRRLNPAAGETAEIRVVYFLLPELKIQPSPQRYTFLRQTAAGEKIFLFEENGLFAGFKAEITMDADGLVIGYPELFERV